MIYPPALNSDDTIAIIAPAGKLKPNSLDAAIKELSNWGLRVELGKHVYDQHNYFAGEDVARLADLQWAINAPRVKAILCARGGYGVTRILSQVNFSPLSDNPKWLIGFSDITALHLQMQKIPLASIHGPMGTSLGQREYQPSTRALQQLLFGNRLPEIEGSGGLPGTVQGRITGGNLSLIVDSLGTANEIDTVGKVLFIEEVGEKTYRLDRMLQQLLRAGKLASLAGLVVGHFTGIEDGDTPFGESWQEVILNAVKEFEYPVGFGFAIGHEPQNLPVVMGGEYQLKVMAHEASLIWLPPV